MKATGAILAGLFFLAFIFMVPFTAGEGCARDRYLDLGKKEGHHDGYRQGQIDAATGKMNYVLTTQPSGEVVWMKK
ncbi:MAG TPA: hypothetical protein VD994_07550 [Prosthecobacter sp.]|nr:hypothetical protein [Prosthecobacter sp.]